MPAAVFGVSHITQFLFRGMPLPDNLFQIARSAAGGVLWGALRLRTNSIWPLIIIHMLENLFIPLSGLSGHESSGMGIQTAWAVLEVAYGIYILRKPITATIDGKAVEEPVPTTATATG